VSVQFGVIKAKIYELINIIKEHLENMHADVQVLTNGNSICTLDWKDEAIFSKEKTETFPLAINDTQLNIVVGLPY
jgi:hypothetical protein